MEGGTGQLMERGTQVADGGRHGQPRLYRPGSRTLLTF